MNGISTALSRASRDLPPRVWTSSLPVLPPTQRCWLATLASCMSSQSWPGWPAAVCNLL